MNSLAFFAYLSGGVALLAWFASSADIVLYLHRTKPC